jgi:hypothetical protein
MSSLWNHQISIKGTLTVRQGSPSFLWQLKLVRLSPKWFLPTIYEDDILPILTRSLNAQWKLM